MNNNNGIRGPRSALTDFLASQNISAAQINAQARARAARAAADEAAQNGSADANRDEAPSQAEEGEDDNAIITRRAQTLKRKKQRDAIEKIKKSKAYKRRKMDDDSDDDLAWELLNEKHVPVPGQMENCAICQKRFTVTAYSRSGPDGGLLCSACGKKVADEEDADKKKQKRKPAAKIGGGRRKQQSRMLDGQVAGVKTLMTLCIETLAKNIKLADDLGYTPPHIVDRIARMLSKHRLVDSGTLPLFLQSQHDAITVYDAAKLCSNDFITIFQRIPALKSLKLRNAIQFTDEVMQYLITRNIEIEKLTLNGANLLSEEVWTQYLAAKGHSLKSLQICYTDKHIGNDFMQTIQESCPVLESLKIEHNQQVSDDGVDHISGIQSLRKLSLDFEKKTSTDPFVNVVANLGKQLQSFSITRTVHVDDHLLDALHEHCRTLTKLRINDSEFMTDGGFTRLFRGWENQPLTYVDLSKCRHVDSNRPRENEHKIGLCSKGFAALMEHSGSALRFLNVHSCRHISRASFESVFAPDQVYPELQHLEISFCEEVTDFICGSIFRSCPKLKELNVFGCMKVKDVKVPRGRILVGVPNAIGMRKEGDDDEDDD